MSDNENVSKYLKAQEPPLCEKLCLTVEEAVAYSGIGEKSIRKALNDPSCRFVFHVGRKLLVKRKEFEQYISGNDEFLF